MQLSDGDNAKNIDLNYFASASGAAPGEYNVDVVMNGELVDRQIKIDFFAQDNKLNARLTPQQLDRWGVGALIPVSSPHQIILQPNKIFFSLLRGPPKILTRTTKS